MLSGQRKHVLKEKLMMIRKRANQGNFKFRWNGWNPHFECYLRTLS